VLQHIIVRNFKFILTTSQLPLMFTLEVWQVFVLPQKG